MSELRDPSAHRIPLYVIPQILNKSESEQYNQYKQEGINKAHKLDFDGADKYFEHIQSIGEFSPLFAHDPNVRPFPMHQVIALDCNSLAEIINKTYVAIASVKTMSLI